MLYFLLANFHSARARSCMRARTHTHTHLIYCFNLEELQSLSKREKLIQPLGLVISGVIHR